MSAPAEGHLTDLLLTGMGLCQRLLPMHASQAGDIPIVSMWWPLHGNDRWTVSAIRRTEKEDVGGAEPVTGTTFYLSLFLATLTSGAVPVGMVGREPRGMPGACAASIGTPNAGG